MKTSIPTFLKLLACLAFPSLLAGCAVAFTTGDTDSVPLPPIDKTYNAEKVSLKDIQDGGVALGGVVIRQGVDVHRNPDLPAPGEEFDHFDQTEFWSHNCEREFAENISGASLTPFYLINDFIEDDLFASMWAKYARGGFIPPELLESAHSAGPQVRFLVFFRVEHDEIFQNVDTSLTIFQTSQSGLGKVSGDGHDPNQVVDSKHPTIKRIVGLTMSLYDLESALCVWESGVFKDVEESIDPEKLNEYAGYQAKQTSTGQVAVLEEEGATNVPAFNRAMDKCLDTLYTDLNRKVDPSSRRR